MHKTEQKMGYWERKGDKQNGGNATEQAKRMR